MIAGIRRLDASLISNEFYEELISKLEGVSKKIE